MNEKEYYVTDTEIYFVDNTLVYHSREKSAGNNKEQVQKTKTKLMNGGTNLCKELHDNQPVIQKRLNHYLKNEAQEEKIVEIKKKL